MGSCEPGQDESSSHKQSSLCAVGLSSAAECVEMTNDEARMSKE
jgi:hypothetical protein